MTYSDKREFAARVFEAVKRGGEYEANPRIVLLAQAQLDALPPEVHHHISASLATMDAAYALAVKLAPLVGVEVMK